MTIEVGVRELRARLSHWVDRAANGDQIVVTERGKPRARLVAMNDAAARRQRLIAEGRLTPAKRPKTTKIRLEDIPEVPGVSLSEILREQRGKS